jgi:hypothetical protein
MVAVWSIVIMIQTFMQASASMPEVVASLHALSWLQNKPLSRHLSCSQLLGHSLSLKHKDQNGPAVHAEKQQEGYQPEKLQR